VIAYEVRARVPVEQAEAYERYLREEHIPDLMATGCFEEAHFSRSEAGDPVSQAAGHPPTDVLFRSAYLAPDRAALDRYLADHAGRLRTHALARFPRGLAFERETWAVLERWGIGSR
jgi:hypothetical protein